MKKIKNDEENYQDPYQFVIATPLNTDMFKESYPLEHHTSNVEQEEEESHFVLPYPFKHHTPDVEQEETEAESHFVLPKTPPPIP